METPTEERTASLQSTSRRIESGFTPCEIFHVNNPNETLFLSLFFILDGQQIWELEATVDKDKSQTVSTVNAIHVTFYQHDVELFTDLFLQLFASYLNI